MRHIKNNIKGIINIHKIGYLEMTTQNNVLIFAFAALVAVGNSVIIVVKTMMMIIGFDKNN